METNGIVNGSATAGDPDVEAVKDEVDLENGSTVDPLVLVETNGIVQDVNGHIGKITEEEGQVVKSTDEVDDANEITNVEAKTDDVVSGITVDPESTLNPIESSQVTVFESESTKESESQVTNTQSVSTPDLINTTDESICTDNPVSNTDCEVMVNDEQESDSNLIDKTECQVTVDGSSKPSEDLECQVTADQSESSESPPQVLEGQVTVDGPGKPSEDLECQVISDEPESGSPINEQECQVPVNGSDSIDSSVDTQESLAPVDVSESNGNHTEKVDSTTTVMESGTKSEEHQDLSIVDSEVNVEDEPNHICNGTEAEHQNEPVSAPCTSEIKKAEETVIESVTESKENPDSGLVLSEDTDTLTNGKLEKFDEILEMGETQISETVADEDVPLVLDAEKEKSEEKLEEQAEGSSESPLEATEPVEFETNIQEMKEPVELEDEIQEPQTVVTDKSQDDLNMEDNTADSTIEAEAPLETEIIEPITHEDTVSQNEVNSCIDETQESAEHVEIIPSTDSVESQCKNETDDLAVVEEKVDIVADIVTENGSAEGMDNGTVIENVDAPNVEEKETKVEDVPVEDHSTSTIPESYVKPGVVIEFGSIGRHETVPSIQNGDVIAVPDVINVETKPASGIDSDKSEQNVDDDKVSCQEIEDINGIQSDEIPTSSVEGSVSDAPDVQNEEESEVLPYNFLIRIPRYEDEMFKEQIRSAQLQVEEKTRIRDAIRVEIQSKRARLRAHNEAFNAAKQQETAARRLVRLKRQEIDSVQFVINRLKNAESVGDIDRRIYNMEHMIQHETLCLKDEKQFIREIKQLKTLRDQLAANMGSQDEVQQAMLEKDQTEEHMRTLRKELEVLKNEVTKAEAATAVVGKKYDEISKRERELQAQFRAADDVRQKAYAHLNSLKKQSYDKNKNFRLYKEDVMAARDFASRGDKDSLHRLCANQVEAFMEQWNNNDEFRNDYVNRCNMNATRRQKYFDGNSLGPDDVSHAPPTEKVDRNLVSIPTEVKPVSFLPPVKQETIVSYPEEKQSEKVATVQKNQTLKTKDVTKESDTSADDKKEEQENSVTKEEMEAARKAEELRKQEIEAKQKEQRRLEEKAKATEALERKKRIAEKAQLRAELRARKEAEQKEKEREKRMRKKEKKKAGGDGSVNGEEAASSESSNEATTKEDINNNNNSNNNSQLKKRSQKPPAHFFSKQLKPKPVPPPAAIRNRKRWQQWVKLALAAVAVLALFLLGNTGFFLNLKIQKPNGNGSGI
ncbi:hypothetical protein L1887_16267 [Cichorium endivia]|nr:hypothetical protein L1887_16267 [Cichorium endivia]